MIWMGALADSEQDRDEFEKIYKEHRQLMFRCALSILGDESSAEDAVSDAFVSFAANFEKTYGMERNQIRGYLIIIVRNASYKIYNKRKRELSTEDIYLDTEDLTDLALDTENQAVHRRVAELIRSMDKKYADVIMLKYYYEMKEKAIAETLGLSVENVKIRLHRARQLLKRMIREEGLHE